MICPHCRWPEYTPVRPACRTRDGALGRLLAALIGRPLKKRTGDIVCCAKCTTQFVISAIAGAYEIDGAQPESPQRANGLDREKKPPVVHRADGDQDWER